MTVGFVESPVFPEKISFGALGGPAYATRVVRTRIGAEYRDQIMEQALHKFEVSHAAKLPTDYRILQNFFHSVGVGRAYGFRFKDWQDYTARSGEGVFSMLTSTTFQMYKVYTSGSNTRNRKIQKPRNNNTIVIGGGASPTIDYATGIVTVSSGIPTSWVGDFDVPCRFDTDEMQGEIEDKTPGGEFIMNWRSIPIIEIQV